MVGLNAYEKRLIRVEEHQKTMTKNIADITTNLKDNTEATLEMKSMLDQLTGVKRFIVWLTSVGLLLTSWLGLHRK